MNKAIKAVGWAVVIAALLGSLTLLFYDQMQTHNALVATEMRLDNAEMQREIYRSRWLECQRQMSDQKETRNE